MPERIRHVCGVVEQLGDGSPSLKLPTNRPLVLIQDALPNHSKDEIWSWMKEAHARWGAACDWQARRISDPAEISPNDYVNLITVADLGGSGVLADQMLPYASGQILRMRINSRISWRATDGPMQSGTIDPIRTLCHEIGHFQGHVHWPEGAPPELMEPRVSQTIIGPQPTEGKVSAGWFGQPHTPSNDDASWITRLYQDLLARTPAPTELSAWLTELSNTGRSGAARRFLGSSEYHKHLVTSWYRTYLRREPDAGGLANFVRALDSGMNVKEALAVVLVSAEYYSRTAGISAGLDPAKPVPTPPPAPPTTPPNGGTFMSDMLKKLQALKTQLESAMGFFKFIPGKQPDELIQTLIDGVDWIIRLLSTGTITEAQAEAQLASLTQQLTTSVQALKAS